MARSLQHPSDLFDEEWARIEPLLSPRSKDGARVSKQTISTITEKVMDGMAEWQNRPLDAVYPVVFLDAINVKIRDGKVANRPIYVALAVTTEGTRDILGLWAGDGGEGAKFWLQIATELRNRGVEDVSWPSATG